MKLNLKHLLISILVLAFTQNIMAQSDDIDEIEAEVVKKKAKKEAVIEKDNFSDKDINFEGLSKLNPFEDLAVIQKRFLPKTQRFQLHLGLNQIQNNPFFINGGAHARLGFFFNEFMGLELNYFRISTVKKPLTSDLNTYQGVKTSTLVAPKAYMGVDLMMVPIYGKMGWLNNKIIPFDLYFSLGAGQTTTTYKDTQAPTLHLGTGQIFATSKSTAFRWDFSWNFYNAKAEKMTDGVGTGQEVNQGFNDLFLGMGFSWFFPEAKYR